MKLHMHIGEFQRSLHRRKGFENPQKMAQIKSVYFRAQREKISPSLYIKNAYLEETLGFVASYKLTNRH